MQCKGKLRMVAKVDIPDAGAAMLRHLGLDRDPNPDPTTKEGSIIGVLPKRKRKTKKDKRYRRDWASLLSRIFAIDVMTRHAVQRQTSHCG